MSLDNLFGLCGRANPDGVGCVRHQGHLRACLYSTERTHRSPSQPAEISQGGEPDFTARERITAVRAIASEWPSHDAGDLYEADGDSIENIAVYLQMKLARQSASPAVQTQPPPSHPAPKDSQQGVCVGCSHPVVSHGIHGCEHVLDRHDHTKRCGCRNALFIAPATPEVRHAPTEGQQGNSDQFRDVTDMVDKHGNPEGNINGGELPPEPVVRVHDVEVEPWDIRYYSVPEVDAYIAALRSAAVSASPIPVAPLDSGLRELLVEAVRLVREYENHRCGRNNCWPDFYKVSTWLQRYKAQTTAVPAEKEDSHA